VTKSNRLRCFPVSLSPCHLATLSLCVLVTLSLCHLVIPSSAQAHPVPKNNHDRTIVVRLRPGPTPEQIVVRVDYRLEVDPTTVILDDMRPFRDEIDITQFKDRLDYFKEFTKKYAPILADHLMAKINGTAVEFTCTERSQTLRDEKGEPLDHLRCDFVFEATIPCFKDKENTLVFREMNYQEQEGIINLTLVNESNLVVINQIEADAAVRTRQANERLPGDEAKLRTVQVTFRFPAEPIVHNPVVSTAPTDAPHKDDHDSGLLRLFLETDYGLWVLLLLAAYIGAMHALTPGHGKTLMAAYLVGEHGTIWHAVLLGLVTALTHTGIVLIIAMGLAFLPAGMSAEARQTLQTGLSLVMGLVVMCLGVYLLLLRLSGRADHIHIGGGHHHHGPIPETTTPKHVSTWGLIFLGISGGLIPCTDAIAMLVLAVGTNLFWLAFPLLLAFSAGLAGVLVLIGILVVKFRRFAGSRWGEGRLVRAMPIVSALLVTVMGFWLCYEAVHG
jgi:nickel/cobalt transporter (NicO) family protein